MTISKQIMDIWLEWWSIAKYQIPISKRFDFVVWGDAGYGECRVSQPLFSCETLKTRSNRLTLTGFFHSSKTTLLF
jgi:hypothetical protein